MDPFPAAISAPSSPNVRFCKRFETLASAFRLCLHLTTRSFPLRLFAGPSSAWSRNRVSFSSHPLPQILEHGLVPSSHGGCVHTGLRRGRRRPCSAPATSTSLHLRLRCACERQRASRPHPAVHRQRHRHLEHRRHLAGQQRPRRQLDTRHHRCPGHVHGSAQSPFLCGNADHGEEPSGHIEIRLGAAHARERHLHRRLAIHGKRRARREPAFLRHAYERRQARHRRRVESLRNGLPRRLRFNRRRRQLHRAAESPEFAGRNPYRDEHG